MLFEDNVVFNGDDCFAVKNPARNIHFRNGYCNGGHGLSVGSLGEGGAVADVQNVLCVIHTLGRSLSLTPLSKDRECDCGRAVIVWVVSDRRFNYPMSQENSVYGARFKSWPGGNGFARKHGESRSAFSTALIESN